MSTTAEKTLKPLGANIVIAQIEAKDKTEGGIYLPTGSKETPQEAEVIAVGPGKKNDKGEHQELEVKIGDKVIYSKFSGTPVKLGNNEYTIIAEADVLAIVEG